MAQRAIRADVIVRGRLLLSELGGVTAETPDPVDGRVERQDDGAPNSLEIGKYADVVVHDCHPFDPVAGGIGSTSVIRTYVAGQLVYAAENV